MKKIRQLLLTSLCAVVVATLSFGTAPVRADGFGFVSISGHPASFSMEPTATFTFNGEADSFECKLDTGSFVACVSPYTTAVLSDDEHTFTVHVVGATNPEATASYTWTINQLPVFSGGTTVTGIANTPLSISDLSITDSGNDSLKVKLSVPSGSLHLSIISGLTFVGSQTGSTIEFSGSRTDLNDALTTLQYTPATVGTTTLSAVIEGANDNIYGTVSNRVFKVIHTSPGLTWADAKTAAEASTYGGATGYLATITSSAENNLIGTELSASPAWFGANDEAAEGDWKWAGGPEADTSFWSGGVDGTAVDGAFTNWQGGMPDNYNGIENCGEVYPEIGAPQWNDQDCNAERSYYVAEYGDGVTIPYIDTKQISVTATPNNDLDDDGLSNTVEDAAPHSGDANNDGTADSQQANVSSQLNPVSGKYMTIQTGCEKTFNVQIGAEAATPKDIAFDYPEGLASFIGTNCGAPGSTVTVTQYYFGNLDPTKFVLRKWDGNQGSYSAISGAVLTAVTIGGQPALKVVYQVVDGGPLDKDGVANGTIVDPVGLGVSVISVPNTGLHTESTSSKYPLLPLEIVLAIGCLLGIYRLRS